MKPDKVFLLINFYVFSKTLIKMANVVLRFICSQDRGSELECFLNKNNEITIKIESNGMEYVCLDKSTAIKLAKTLRTEINKIEG
jgi:hypothetical protein